MTLCSAPGSESISPELPTPASPRRLPYLAQDGVEAF